MKKVQNDTIVAITTGAVQAGVGMVRLSGPKSLEIATQIFSPKNQTPLSWPSHQLNYGKIQDQEETIDVGFAVYMQAPQTFTGEDIVEIHLHGSPIVLQKIVSLCKAHGARISEPGEYSKRAFLNGKIDLIQAEAIAELIHSESEEEAKAAQRRIEGKLSNAMHQIRKDTISILAECEADVDFPEEGLSLSNRPHLLEKFDSVSKRIDSLLATYSSNQRLSQGFVVSLIGRPNVGKSSLFNSLLKMDRAIVTPIPGTTRDVLREEIILCGRRVRLIDTAGIRSGSEDPVEKIGIQKTETEIKNADLIFLICDASEGLTTIEKEWIAKHPKNLWIVWNKADLKPDVDLGKDQHLVSALTSQGIEKLVERLSQHLSTNLKSYSEGGISNDRQYQLFKNVQEAFGRVRQELKKNASPEFVAFELQDAYRAISKILGEDDSVESILGEIFSKFCIGK